MKVTHERAPPGCGQNSDIDSIDRKKENEKHTSLFRGGQKRPE